MTKNDIELMLLIHLKGPQNLEDIQSFVTVDIVGSGHAWWMPTDRGQKALTLTNMGELWVKEALRVIRENFGC